MYVYKSNISWIIELYEQFFKEKKLGGHSQDYYASIRGLLTQLELYHLYTIDLTTQHHYREELVVVIFLAGLETLTFQI